MIGGGFTSRGMQKERHRQESQDGCKACDSERKTHETHQISTNRAVTEEGGGWGGHGSNE